MHDTDLLDVGVNEPSSAAGAIPQWESADLQEETAEKFSTPQWPQTGQLCAD